jgi:hypothetical protein
MLQVHFSRSGTVEMNPSESSDIIATEFARLIDKCRRSAEF